MRKKMHWTIERGEREWLHKTEKLRERERALPLPVYIDPSSIACNPCSKWLYAWVGALDQSEGSSENLGRNCY